MRWVHGFILLLVFFMLLFWSTPRLSGLMANRPALIKLGFTPPPTILKLSVAEYRYTVAEIITLKVLMYFGSLVAQWKDQNFLPPEYFNMFRTLDSALHLDPYNADIYYFAQAVFTWDVGRVEDVNRFLEYGMKYRTWDPMLPFFAGFNAAYFLRDYDTAASHMQLAAEISGNPSMARLASRYYYESGRPEIAVPFLEEMIRSAPSRREADLYRLRRDALASVKILQDAVIVYRNKIGRFPDHLLDLQASGVLKDLPKDPYGGCFYIDDVGQVKSTSKFALKPNIDMTGRSVDE